MKLIIFAGGIGTRLWPLSRQNSPKQFEKFFDGQSTVQLAVKRTAPAFGMENIYIQTIDAYKNIIREQIPELSAANIIIEPERRNLAPAVCLAMNELKKSGYAGPVALLWADHLMKRNDRFVFALQIAEKLILENPNRFVFLAEKPRFANNNLGWIKIGEPAGQIDGEEYYGFAGWKYRPPTEECNALYDCGQYFWNPGYFITSVDFLLDQYQKLAADIYQAVTGGDYGSARQAHFDEAVIEKVDLKNAVVIKTDMGWSDPGTLYALKEALTKSVEENAVSGRVKLLHSRDCLVYNLAADKLVAGLGLDGLVVVNTPDALIVAPKNEVVKITELINQLKQEGLEKYL